jgi:hypothetical protein
VLVGQFPQLADLVEDLVRCEEMRCTVDLHLRSHKDSADRAGQDHLVDRVVTAMDPAAGIGAHGLNWNALILGIDDMFTLGNSANDKSPLGMEEAGIESDIFPIGRQVEQVNAVFGDR